MHPLFWAPTLKNSVIKRAYCRPTWTWVTSCEVSQATCERGQNTPEKLAVIFGAEDNS